MSAERSASEQAVQGLWATIADREARLLTLIEASAQIVWVMDASGDVLGEPPVEIAHLTWSAFTGMTQESMRGRGWIAAIHQDDFASITNLIRSARASGAPIYCEFRVRHKSGEWRWMICRGNAVRSGGEIIGWIGTCTDITEAKRTEAALRESQTRLVAALEAGQMSTWIWRLSDHTFWWDEAGEKLWGLTCDPLRSHNLEDLQTLIHPDDRIHTRRAIESTLSTGVAASVEFRTVRPDGKLQWISSRGRVEYDEHGKPVQVVGAFADITKVKAAEESLRQAQKMQALGTLAGGIAHDFNNLLLTIGGNARLGLKDILPNHPSHRSLEEIAKASTRASDLVRRILSFSAPQPMAPATTPLMPAIDEALKLLQSSVPRTISIQTRCDDATLACTLGAAEFQQVIVNLVTNAVHAIGERPGTIEIGVSRGEVPDRSKQAQRFAQIVVRDSGCGMDALTRARIFDPFFTTKPSGKGTGLGLAVVHGVVHGCGGAIVVDSEVNRGATFTLWLPLAQGVAEVAPEAPQPRGSGERILYVDDDESITFLVQRLLTQLGYRVTTCEHPHRACELFADDPTAFDIVITDLSMPEMSGFDVLRAIKTARADVPTILTSGYVRDEDQVRAASLGIDHIILKPNTIDELGKSLDTICRELRERGTITPAASQRRAR